MTQEQLDPIELVPPEAITFYQETMRILQEEEVPFLISGAYAFRHYTGVVRQTKDFDLFLKEGDLERAMGVLEARGYRTEFTFQHWLAKAYCEDKFVDLIFRSGNGISAVDERWFERAEEDRVLGMRVLLSPPEELLWTKAFIMERERYDGADVVHILRAQAERIDWRRLVDVFGAHWRVLFSHLVLFGFIYPSERKRIPQEVMEELAGRMREEYNSPAPTSKVCNGTLISRQQYLIDIEEWGYADARLEPRGEMSEEEIEAWTEAIKVDGDGGAQEH